MLELHRSMMEMVIVVIALSACRGESFVSMVKISTIHLHTCA